MNFQPKPVGPLRLHLDRTTRLRASIAVVALATWWGAGCANSTIESRKTEKALAYGALPPEQRELVNQGRIRVGMSPDAVYVAWGEPAQVLHSGNANGEVTTWLYTATATDTYHTWRYREYPRRNGSVYLDRSFDVDYAFRDYVSAELIFREGQLESWRMLPKPPERDVLSSAPLGY